jgi:hypothetical protein
LAVSLVEHTMLMVLKISDLCKSSGGAIAPGQKSCAPS